MKQTRITQRFANISDDALEGYATSIAASLIGNSNFPEPNPSLATFNEGIKAFSDALLQAKTRHRNGIALKNARRADLEQLLRDMAHYCSYMAKGDRPMLVSSGFTVSAEVSVAKMLSLPSNLSVDAGNNSGQVYVSADRVKSARTYLFLYGPAPVENDSWQHVATSFPYCNISGLEPGKMYSFKLGVTGARGEALYTEPISRMVPW